MTGAKKLSFTILAILLPLLACALLAEATLAILRPQRVYRHLRELTGEQYAPNAFIPFTLKASYSSKMPSMEHWGTYVPITTNALGMRGPETTIEKSPGKKRVLILGDSYTFGLYVADNETFAAKLQELLDPSRQKIEVINAGYADGGDPDEHYSWLVNQGLKFKPDVVIYGFFVGNDISGIRSERWTKRDADGLPTQIVDPNLYIDEFGTRRSRIQGDFSVGGERIYRLPVLRESHLAVYISNKVNQHFFRPKEVSAAGWGNQSFGFLLKSKAEMTQSMKDKEVEWFKIVTGMKKRSEEAGAKFGILEIPVNFEVEPALLPLVTSRQDSKIERDYFAEIASHLDALGIPYVNLLPLMKQTTEHLYPRNGEVHFNANGHRVAAESLAPMVRKLLKNEK